MQTNRNRYGRVHGEFNSADATTAAAVTFYTLGTVAARAIADTERIALLSAIISAAAATRVRVFADADDDGAVDAGEALIDVYVAAGGAVALNFDENTMPEGMTDAPLKVIAADIGAVSVILEGIVRTPTTKAGPAGTPIHSP